MARLILPMQREQTTHRIGEMKAIPVKQDTNTAASGTDEKPTELRPLIVKSVERTVSEYSLIAIIFSLEIRSQERSVFSTA